MSLGDLKLWSKDYEISNTINSSIQQVTGNYTSNVQQCSQQFFSSSSAVIDGCTINGNIEFSQDAVATSNCILSSTTAISTTNAAYQDATNSASTQVANSGCSAQFGGASIAVLANVGGGSVDCSLPQDTTVKMTNTINLQILQLTVTAVVYMQDCNQVFSATQSFQCYNSVVNGNINFTQSAEASNTCNMETNTTIETYNTATQYASNSATAEEVNHTGSGIGILGIFFFIIIIIVICAATQNNKNDEQERKKVESGLEAQRRMIEQYKKDHGIMSGGGNDEEVDAASNKVDARKLRESADDAIPIISSVVFVVAIVNLVIFLCCYLFVLPPMPDPYASPSEFEAYGAAGKAWLLFTSILGAGGLAVVIAENVMIDSPDYGLAWHVHDARIKKYEQKGEKGAYVMANGSSSSSGAVSA